MSPALRAGVPRLAPRRYGLAAIILAADGVTAGSPGVRADRTDNPDLLRVRGAGTCAPARGKTRPHRRRHPQEGEAPATGERNREKQGENHGRQRI